MFAQRSSGDRPDPTAPNIFDILLAMEPDNAEMAPRPVDEPDKDSFPGPKPPSAVAMTSIRPDGSRTQPSLASTGSVDLSGPDNQNPSVTAVPASKPIESGKSHTIANTVAPVASSKAAATGPEAQLTETKKPKRTRKKKQADQNPPAKKENPKPASPKGRNKAQKPSPATPAPATSGDQPFPATPNFRKPTPEQVKQEIMGAPRKPQQMVAPASNVMYSQTSQFPPTGSINSTPCRVEQQVEIPTPVATLTPDQTIVQGIDPILKLKLADTRERKVALQQVLPPTPRSQQVLPPTPSSQPRGHGAVPPASQPLLVTPGDPAIKASQKAFNGKLNEAYQDYKHNSISENPQPARGQDTLVISTAQNKQQGVERIGKQIAGFSKWLQVRYEELNLKRKALENKPKDSAEREAHCQDLKTFQLQVQANKNRQYHFNHMMEQVRMEGWSQGTSNSVTAPHAPGNPQVQRNPQLHGTPNRQIAPRPQAPTRKDDTLQMVAPGMWVRPESQGPERRVLDPGMMSPPQYRNAPHAQGTPQPQATVYPQGPIRPQGSPLPQSAPQMLSPVRQGTPQRQGAPFSQSISGGQAASQMMGAVRQGTPQHQSTPFSQSTVRSQAASQMMGNVRQGTPQCQTPIQPNGTPQGLAYINGTPQRQGTSQCQTPIRPNGAPPVSAYVNGTPQRQGTPQCQTPVRPNGAPPVLVYINGTPYLQSHIGDATMTQVGIPELGAPAQGYAPVQLQTYPQYEGAYQQQGGGPQPQAVAQYQATHPNGVPQMQSYGQYQLGPQQQVGHQFQAAVQYQANHPNGVPQTQGYVNYQVVPQQQGGPQSQAAPQYNAPLQTNGAVQLQGGPQQHVGFQSQHMVTPIYQVRQQSQAALSTQQGQHMHHPATPTSRQHIALLTPDATLKRKMSAMSSTLTDNKSVTQPNFNCHGPANGRIAVGNRTSLTEPEAKRFKGSA